MNIERMLRAATAAGLALLLTACAGLPTSGPVTNGLPVGEAQSDTEFTQVATGPVRGWSPEQIVAGFLEASISPADGWSIARQFLTPDLADSWLPGSGVTIDANVSSRSYESSIDDGDDAEEGTVVVELDQVASVDSGGGYSEATGSTPLPFTVGRNGDGEWRITQAPDGVVIDQTAFEQVFSSYALQYFDRSWSRLVPDLRWYPKNNVATRITRTMLEDGPAEWLLPAVQSAFPADVALARAAVPIDGQVAEVELTEAALGLDTVTLARMRTQLQASLKPAGITEVRFTVNGRTVDAQTVPIAAGADNSTLVLTEDGFGVLLSGELSPVPGISGQLEQLEQPVAAIDLAEDQEFAAVQLATGAVLAVADGRVEELDVRAGLIRPSVDPMGYVWTVPVSDPLSVKAWRADAADAEGEEADVKGVWPAASAISALRVAADGTRLAAVITLGGHQRVVVAAVVRDDSGAPTGLGPMKDLADVPDGAADLSWLGSGELAVLVSRDDSLLLTQPVGGPGTTASAPAGAASIAGAAERNGLRLLGAGGVLYAPRASVWQEYFSDVVVLGTRAGF